MNPIQQEEDRMKQEVGSCDSLEEVQGDKQSVKMDKSQSTVTNAAVKLASGRSGSIDTLIVSTKIEQPEDMDQ